MNSRLNKYDLISYINEYYISIGMELTPIRIQKTLYFLFALWGGKNADYKKTELEGESPSYLFDADFSAWRYGPVDETIYREYKENLIELFSKGNHHNVHESLTRHERDYIDEILNELRRFSDFRLVDITHGDVSWSSVYDESGNAKMDLESICEEYAKKRRATSN